MDPERLPVFVPQIGPDTLNAVSKAFDDGWLGMGATTRRFEEQIAERVGTLGRHVIATNNGTSAIHIAVALSGAGPGDEVIVPSFNFVADHQAIIAQGADPVFCDILEEDLGIDPDKVELLVTERTKAIMPLHYAGLPCHIDRVYDIARAHGLRVIEDATHAFGSIHEGRPIGSFGDITCFSFDPVKIVTSIDGGAVVLAEEKEAERARRLRLLGIDKETELRHKNQRAWDYDVTDAGFRYHLTNVNASIGLSQLERLDEFISSRQHACRLYNELLGGIDELALPQTDFEGVAPFIYTVRVQDGSRERLIDRLLEHGVETGIHFVPVHHYTLFEDCRRGDMSITETVSSQILTLPLHSGMAAATVERVAALIRAFFGN